MNLEEDLNNLKILFPQVNEDIIKEVYHSCGDNVENSIDQLLQIQDSSIVAKENEDTANDAEIARNLQNEYILEENQRRITQQEEELTASNSSNEGIMGKIQSYGVIAKKKMSDVFLKMSQSLNPEQPVLLTDNEIENEKHSNAIVPKERRQNGPNQ